MATISLANAGGSTVTNVMLTTTQFGAIAGTPLPQNIGTIAAGAVATTTVTLPNVTSGAAGKLSIVGTYTG